MLKKNKIEFSEKFCKCCEMVDNGARVYWETFMREVYGFRNVRGRLEWTCKYKIVQVEKTGSGYIIDIYETKMNHLTITTKLILRFETTEFDDLSLGKLCGLVKRKLRT